MSQRGCQPKNSARCKPQSCRFGIAPILDAEGEYRLTPGSIVGASEIGDLSVLIRAQDWHPTTALNGVLRH